MSAGGAAPPRPCSARSPTALTAGTRSDTGTGCGSSACARSRGADRAEEHLALLLTAAERQLLVDLVRQALAPREQRFADEAATAWAPRPRPRRRLTSLLGACRGARTTSVPDVRPAGLPSRAVAGQRVTGPPF
jgi:hypothetical protein